MIFASMTQEHVSVNELMMRLNLVKRMDMKVKERRSLSEVKERLLQVGKA